MSILIHGMEMPQKCGQCKLFHAEYPMYCMAVKGYRTVGAPYGMPRPDWCPIVEVKEPHGRLGDLDELIDGCEKLMRMLDPEGKEYLRVFAIKSYLMWAAEYAVIEAEGRDT